MTPPPTFFALLRERTTEKVDRNFDQRFWAKFESEFAPATEPSLWSLLKDSFQFKLAVGAMSAAAIGAILFTQTVKNPGNELGGLDPALLASLTDVEAMSEDLDLFQGVKGLDGTEVASLTDADWDVLLSDSGAS